MATLYELHDQLREAIAEHVDPITGEISDEGLAALQAVELAFDAKALSCAAYIKSLEAKADGFIGEAQSVESHAAALRARAKACLNSAESFKGYIALHLEEGSKLEDGRVRISWGTATGLEIQASAEQLPAWAQRVSCSPDRKALADAVKGVDGLAKQRIAVKLAKITKRRFLKIG
jgi:hypothetical protein